MTSSAEKGPTIRTNARSKLEKDQVTGRVSVAVGKPPLLQMFYGNFIKFGNKVNVDNKVHLSNKVATECSIYGVTVYGHVPECHVLFGRGTHHNT